MNTQSITKKQLSIKTQSIATIGAVAAAVVLPQLFHTTGQVAGLGTSLGEAFLPMHLPIILVGLLAGPYAGLAAGILAPLVSFGLTGMPGVMMLPFIVIELAMYGLFAGLLRSKNLPTLAKVLLVQLSGRAVRAGAILLSVYGFANSGLSAAVIWSSIVAGLPGLILQWSLLPLLLFWVENRGRNEH